MPCPACWGDTQLAGSVTTCSSVHSIIQFLCSPSHPRTPPAAHWQSYVAERGSTPPEATPRVPTEAPDKLPAGSPRVRRHLPWFAH